MKSRIAFIGVGALTLLAPFAALASTAANTVITNTASVNYNDAGGNAQAQVDSLPVAVTVTLVPSAVTLSSPPNQTIAQGTNATLTYTITGTANGQDTYTLSATATASNDSTVTPVLPANITLGGTTLAATANAGDTSISVPYDNVAGTTVNGIGAGSVIVVGGNAYTVSSVTKNPAANTTTVALSTAIAGTAVAAGTIVGERKTFSETVASGNVTVGNSSGTQTVSTTAVSATSPAATTTQATATVITVNRPTLTVTKLVSTDGGTTFGASGAAIPGTALIYKIIASNTGVTSASTVTFTDVVPQYLTYQAGTARFATVSATAYSAATALTEGTGGYSFTPATATVSYNPGGATGTVAGGSVLVLFFQAKIN
jgi:uncharacterized repeat protein (TIGR01451 family)